MDTLKLTVVLPVLGKQEELDRFLEPFHGFKQDGSWELIVVDDHSPTPLMVDDGSWQLIRTQERSGAARCRNIGADRARGEYLVFLSSFLLIPDNYLEKLRRFIEENDFEYAQHPLVVAEGVSVDHFQSFLGNQIQRVTGSAGLSIKQSLFTSALIKRSVFEDLGGFDAEMQHYGGHELDLIYRLEKADYRKRLMIKSIPLGRNSVSDETRTRSRLQEYGSTGLPNLLAKHPELKRVVLPLDIIWKPFWLFGLTRLLESIIRSQIERNLKLPQIIYRLYLHLVVRNAWESR